MRTVAFVGLFVGLAPQTAFRAQADNVGFPRWRLDALDSLFGAGTLPSTALQTLFADLGPGRSAIDSFAVLIYALWLPVALLVLWYVVRARWDCYRGFAWTWFGLWYLSSIAFVLLPVEPPWMLTGVERTLAEGTTDVVRVDPNQFAAFPSLHVAMPAALAFQARASSMPRMARGLFVFAALTAFAVVHLGEHYVIDTLAGLIAAWLAVQLTARVLRHPVMELSRPEQARAA